MAITLYSGFVPVCVQLLTGLKTVLKKAEDHATIAFVPRDSLLEFLRRHCDFCMQVVRLLSEDLHRLYHKFRSISAHPGRPRHRPPDEQLN